MATSTNPTRLVTGKVRLSYVKVSTPDENGKYSLCVLIDKKDKVTLAKIKAAVDFLKTDPKAVGIWKSKFLDFKTPLRDGDKEKDTDGQPEYKDHYFLNCSTRTQPQIVDTERNPIISNEELYSGCYARLSLNLYAFNVEAKGIAVGLNNIQKLGDGDRLDSHTSAEDDFGPDEGEEEEDFLG